MGSGRSVPAAEAQRATYTPSTAASAAIVVYRERRSPSSSGTPGRRATELDPGRFPRQGRRLLEVFGWSVVDAETGEPTPIAHCSHRHENAGRRLGRHAAHRHADQAPGHRAPTSSACRTSPSPPGSRAIGSSCATTRACGLVGSAVVRQHLRRRLRRTCASGWAPARRFSFA